MPKRASRWRLSKLGDPTEVGAKDGTVRPKEVGRTKKEKARARKEEGSWADREGKGKAKWKDTQDKADKEEK